MGAEVVSEVWFTSDPHIGHRLVAAHRGFGDGPTQVLPEDADEHDAYLAKEWDKRVKPDDHVWVLGDMSAGGTAAQGYALSWLVNRPGTKHLIAGNHDGCHPMHRNAHKWLPVYLTAFETVQVYARRKINGHNVMLSHMPYDGDHYDADRFTQYRLPDEGLPLLHGHTHSTGVVTRSAAGSLQISVGLDAWAWNLGPVNLSDIANFLS